MLDFLAELGVPVIVAVTKVDKLKPLQATARVAELTTQLGLDPEQVIPFSARTGAGRDELADAVEMLVTQPDWRMAP
jgi:GTP-binding protein